MIFVRVGQAMARPGRPQAGTSISAELQLTNLGYLVRASAGYLKAGWLKIFGPVFLCFRPEIDPKTP